MQTISAFTTHFFWLCKSVNKQTWHVSFTTTLHFIHGFQFQRWCSAVLAALQRFYVRKPKVTQNGVFLTQLGRSERKGKDALSVRRGQSKPLKFKTKSRAGGIQTEHWQWPLGRKSKQWPRSLWSRTKWLPISGGRPLGARSFWEPCLAAAAFHYSRPKPKHMSYVTGVYY